MFRQRMRIYFDGVDWNVAIAFWLFGNQELIIASQSRLHLTVYPFRAHQQHPLCDLVDRCS